MYTLYIELDANIVKDDNVENIIYTIYSVCIDEVHISVKIYFRSKFNNIYGRVTYCLMVIEENFLFSVNL